MCTRPLHHSWRAAARRDHGGRAAARRDPTWEGSSCPQVPSAPGKEKTGPGVAANKNNDAAVFMEPVAVLGVSPPSQLCSLQPGKGITLLCLSKTATQCPRSHVGCRPCLAGHIQKSKSITPHARQPQTCWHLLTGCSPPTVAIWESGVPLRWRSAACPWSSPSGWALPCSPLSGTVASTPRATSCGSACPRSRTPAG